ncbi:MAG: CDP-alcohol phosphatidyltransferase family protein [Candidatus Aminicenantes bacterium]|nr:MAG: CDP-alcohol phosphatidyltransferase family protein [Candidatus Aminicenantes bacterium]
MRILAIPAIVLLIIHSTPANYPVLILVFFISILLDFFDGYLARKLSQETELGQILDPLADKLMVSCIVVVLIVKTNFPWWLGILIIGRDLVILVAGAIILKRKQVVKPSILIGKVVFALLGALIMTYILDLHQYIDLEILKRFFIVLTVSFSVWSWIEYYQVYKKEKNAR